MYRLLKINKKVLYWMNEWKYHEICLAITCFVDYYLTTRDTGQWKRKDIKAKIERPWSLAKGKKLGYIGALLNITECCVR